MYFSGDSLTDAPGVAREALAIPTVPHTTGQGTRWLGQIGDADIDYSAWVTGAESRLAFTSDVLATPMTVCGFPVITIDVSAAEADGVLIAYLEVVGANGVASYITEGPIRLGHRGTTQPATRTDQRLERSFAEADFAPMQPGRPASISFEMMPMSSSFLPVLGSGCRLRPRTPTTCVLTQRPDRPSRCAHRPIVQRP